MTAPALVFERFGLSFGSGARRHVLFENVDLEVPTGKLLLLVGESGSGKSSLLRLICGLFDPRGRMPGLQGRVSVLGRRITALSYPSSLRGPVQAVLQDEGLLDELSPRGNVELALDAAGRSKRLAPALLASSGLSDPPAEIASLSGGMRKRAAVARALAGEPELLVFDEPTAGLDRAAAQEIAGLIANTHRQAGTGRTTIVITHEPEPFAGLADGELWIDAEGHDLKLVEAGLPAAPSKLVEPAAVPDEDPALAGLRHLLLGFSAWAQTLWSALRHLPPIFPGLAARTALRYLLEAALFVVVGCAVVGGLATFFALRNNPMEGAFTAAVITGSGKVLVSVLVPLLAGFFFTARIAAGAAARLGTMKRASQVDGLRLLGIDPADYLLTPMVWGMGIAMPLVTAAGIVTASLASFVATRLVSGQDSFGWATAYFEAITRADLRFALAKTMISALLVAVSTYHLAMGPKRSGRDVGQSVNQGIVTGIFLVLTVHAILTLLQFG